VYYRLRMLPESMWQTNLFPDVSLFFKALPIIVALLLAVLFVVFYAKGKGAVPRSFVWFSIIIGFSSLVVASSVLTVLQYQAFMSGPLQYELPPHKPLTDYFLGFAFFNFWTYWVVGLAVTGSVSLYWWFIKFQSKGVRINTEEILIFILFGGLCGWPLVMVYVFFAFLFYIAALLFLNLAAKMRVKLRILERICARFMPSDEIRVPILPYFVLAAPVALVLGPAILKALNLTYLYIVPRLAY